MAGLGRRSNTRMSGRRFGFLAIPWLSLWGFRKAATAPAGYAHSGTWDPPAAHFHMGESFSPGKSQHTCPLLTDQNLGTWPSPCSVPKDYHDNLKTEGFSPGTGDQEALLELSAQQNRCSVSRSREWLLGGGRLCLTGNPH